MAITQDKDELKNVMKAFSRSNKENWTKAMEEEMKFMISNQVWELVNLWKDIRPLGINDFSK